MIFVVTDMFGAHDDSVSGDLLSHVLTILSDGQQKAYFQFGHRFNIAVNLTVKAGPADIRCFCHNIPIRLRYADRNIVD